MLTSRSNLFIFLVQGLTADLVDICAVNLGIIRECVNVFNRVYVNIWNIGFRKTYQICYMYVNV